MLTWLNFFRIKNRIICLTILPFCLIAWLSFDQYKKLNDEHAVLDKLDIVLSYAEASSQLLTLLTQEKVLSYAYTDDKGNTYDQLLNSKIKAVDEQFVLYRAYLKKNESLLRQAPDFYKSIEKAQQTFSQLGDIRDKIRQKQVKVDGVWTMRLMDAVVRDLLESISQVVKLSTKNESLSLAVRGYYSLLEAQNHSSTEAAIRLRVSNMETLNIPARYSRMREFSILEMIFLKDFFSYSPPAVQDYFNEIFPNSEENIQVSKIRGERQNKYNVNHNLNPNLWFDLSSRRMALLAKVDKFAIQNIVNSIEQLQTNFSHTQFVLLASILLATAVILLLSGMIILSITRPLLNLQESLNYLSQEKDLTFQVVAKGKDEISDVATATNGFISSVKQAVDAVMIQSEAVSQASCSVSNAMHKTQKISQSQSLAMDSVSVAVEQMNATIKEITATTYESSNVVKNAQGHAEEADKAAKSTLSYIDEMSEELTRTEVSVAALSHESNSIGSVLNVIQGIAEQTNLLALNAAIEAARAGEQGRGFAVVADEVRSLAKRTQEATGTVQKQIESLQAGALSAIQNMTLLQEKSDKTVSAVGTSSDLFTQLQENLYHISGFAEQIATASEQQSNVVEEINERIHLITDDTTQMNIQVEETEAVAEGLENTSQNLVLHVKQFKF